VRNTIRPAYEPRVPTTTTTTARATTTIEDVGGVTTVTTTVTAVGHQTRGVRGPLSKASATRSSPRISVLRPTCLGTTGTAIPAYILRTTDSLATSGERRTTSSSSRICRCTFASPRGHGSSTYHWTRSTTRPTYAGSLLGISKALTCVPASSGSCATASSSRGRAYASTSGASSSAALSSPE
jgi:hypothetical protein